MTNNFNAYIPEGKSDAVGVMAPSGSGVPSDGEPVGDAVGGLEVVPPDGENLIQVNTTNKKSSFFDRE